MNETKAIPMERRNMTASFLPNFLHFQTTIPPITKAIGMALNINQKINVSYYPAPR